MVPIFVFCNFAFKACNADWIMSIFGKKRFSSIFTWWFKGELYRYSGKLFLVFFSGYIHVL